MLSQESLSKIDLELAKYPEDQKRSAIMSALRIAQIEHNWLSTELINYVADYINIPPDKAQGKLVHTVNLYLPTGFKLYIL